MTVLDSDVEMKINPIVLLFDNSIVTVGKQQSLTGQICVEGKGIHYEFFDCKKNGLKVQQKVDVTTQE